MRKGIERIGGILRRDGTPRERPFVVEVPVEARGTSAHARVAGEPGRGGAAESREPNNNNNNRVCSGDKTRAENKIKW